MKLTPAAVRALAEGDQDEDVRFTIDHQLGRN